MGRMMGRKAKELSALEVGRLIQPGMHFVGGVAGLALLVASPAARSWILRVMVGGKRRDMGLGGFPDVPLAMARERARQQRDLIRQGIDPIEQAQAARSALLATRSTSKTFKEAAQSFIDMRSAEWKNAKHTAQWLTTLETYAYPHIGTLLVRDIALAQVMDVLEPIWTIKTETATRVRGRIESVLDWAAVKGYRPKGDNPARWRGNLDKLLPRPEKVAKTQSFAALPWQQMGSFMQRLRKQPGMGARALEFAILTAARSGEVRGATWAEFDLDGKIWTIPAGRMKAGKEHRVTLNAAAVDLLRKQPAMVGVELVFPTMKGTALSDMTLTAVLRRMEVPVTAHGFRSSFRDWAAESTAYPHEVVEMALAHAIQNKTEAAYRRGDLIEKRSRLMEDWASHCATVAADRANVTSIRSTAA
jgi:integrase